MLKSEEELKQDMKKVMEFLVENFPNHVYMIGMSEQSGENGISLMTNLCVDDRVRFLTSMCNNALDVSKFDQLVSSKHIN